MQAGSSEDDFAEGGEHNGDRVDGDQAKNRVVQWIKSICSKTEIDARTLKLMIKCSLPPTITLAAYQSDAWSGFYTTIGYLVSIISILTLSIKPRASFLQNLLINILMSCLGVAVSILAMYCAVRARLTSGTPNLAGAGGPDTSGQAAAGAETVPYNSSASAVAAVWLFVQIYFTSTIRAWLPQYNVPCILWAIVANVSMVYAPQFPTVAVALTFARKFLIAYLTGFGVATGVSLFVFPMTCRGALFGSMTQYITHMRSALSAQLDYLRTLEDTDMFAAQKTNTAGQKPRRSPEAEAFRTKMRELAAVHAKLVADLPFAKREIVYGKLGPSDLQAISSMLRLLLVPMTGLSYISDIFERTSEEWGWDRSRNFSQADISEAQDDNDRARIESINEWHELIQRLRKPFSGVIEVIDGGLQHIALTLELAPRTKASKKLDAEEKSGVPQPGDKDFAQCFDRRSREFLESKKVMLRGWCTLHGVDLPDDFFENPTSKDFHTPVWMHEGVMTDHRRRLRRQLSLMLFIEYSLYYVSRRTYDLVLCVDQIKSSGKLERKRIIVPGMKRLRKWAVDAFFRSQDNFDEHDLDEHRPLMSVQLGDAYRKKDPDHLPPQNAWERLSDHLRIIPRFFKSPAASFGLRVAVATTAVALLSFLHHTQVWATKNRLFWTHIMVSIGMQPSAGNTLKAYILRSLGTLVAMLMAWVAWYIVDGKASGVIVFFFVFSLPSAWILVKRPTLTTLGMIYPITMVLILGYELQVHKIGKTIAQSNGQEYYPIYILGPIRLATVVSGLTVAWIFTIFPFPISEHSRLRTSLGTSLHLLANYYSVLHETVRLRLSGAGENSEDKSSPAYKLAKARSKLFVKCNSILSSLKAQADATSLDIPVGGQFPRQQYDTLIDKMSNLLNYMAIVGIASENFCTLLDDTKDHGSEWLHNFRRINNEANITSEAITALLVQLASAITMGQPLPPYLRVPEPYRLAYRMDQIDSDLLSIRHIAEPGYAAFAVVLIGTRCITDDLNDILAGVRQLVGELDFSFRIVNPDQPRRSEETLVYKSHASDQSRNKQD